MNQLIVRTLLGRDANAGEAPVILDTYANTSSAGSIIAFHSYQDDLPKRRPWRDLLVWRGVLDRLRGGAQKINSSSVTKILDSNENVSSSSPTKVRSRFLCNKTFPARMIALSAHQ
jgi:hypothetical protein